MDAILRGFLVYSFLLILFRISGKRTLAQTSGFEFVLLLIISETTQQAMVDNDNSITNGFLLITTLIGLSIILSFVKQKFPEIEKWLDDTPLVLIDNGRMHEHRMDEERIDKSDILEAARKLQGVEQLDDIKYAVLERNGEITIVKKPATT